MQCPLCKVDLLMADRQGIEIDYCPKCRGIWLDRGELEKIIERSAVEAPPPQYPRQAQEYREDYQHRHHDDDSYKYSHKKYKKGSFLGDLFDL